jgi:GNAT superfamily N-acetyltransferase
MSLKPSDHAGVGRSLFEWATQQAISHGRSYLCLDCLSTNRRLRRYYEDLGFKPVGEKSGPSDHPHSATPGSWQAVLYEMAIPAKHCPNQRLILLTLGGWARDSMRSQRLP